MIEYRYSDNGDVMELRRIDSRWPDAIDVEWCAIGRSSPWPVRKWVDLPNPRQEDIFADTWKNRQADYSFDLWNR